ncbi:Single-stranded DNA-binding protein 3 [Anabarilius grahami]|uniref:Single-stranded DNA-binding protein 3 n=1 Tax=Anabarilius grahami TaxID=495550 RepID=A0A3N0XRV7_ANAGA|nr:Single-stranded DNA-binding protein 3 [Anabarilius grahami]
MRPPNSMGPGMPGVNMGAGAGRLWPNPNNGNTGPPGGAGGGGCPPGTPIIPSPADSTNSGENLYTLINSVPPGGNRSSFPMGPGSDGPMGGLEPHHMNGSLGSGDIDGLPKNSPNNLSGMSNPPGTPRDDSELILTNNDNECVKDKLQLQDTSCRCLKDQGPTSTRTRVTLMSHIHENQILPQLWMRCTLLISARTDEICLQEEPV